jgi:hypothetical protein
LLEWYAETFTVAPISLNRQPDDVRRLGKTTDTFRAADRQGDQVRLSAANAHVRWCTCGADSQASDRDIDSGLWRREASRDHRN